MKIYTIEIPFNTYTHVQIATDMTEEEVLKYANKNGNDLIDAHLNRDTKTYEGFKIISSYDIVEGDYTPGRCVIVDTEEYENDENDCDDEQ